MDVHPAELCRHHGGPGLLLSQPAGGTPATPLCTLWGGVDPGIHGSHRRGHHHWYISAALLDHRHRQHVLYLCHRAVRGRSRAGGYRSGGRAPSARARQPSRYCGCLHYHRRLCHLAPQPHRHHPCSGVVRRGRVCQCHCGCSELHSRSPRPPASAAVHQDQAGGRQAHHPARQGGAL